MAHSSLKFFGLFNSVLSRFSSTVCFNSQFVGFLLLVWVFLVATGENNVFRTGKSESKAKSLAGWSRGRCHAWNYTPRLMWFGISSWLSPSNEQGYMSQLWKAANLPCCNERPECSSKKWRLKEQCQPACAIQICTSRARIPRQRSGASLQPDDPPRPVSSSGGSAWAAEPVPRGLGFLGAPAGAVFMNGSDGTPPWARGVTASPHCCYTRTALTGEQKAEWSGAAANSGKDNLGNYLILPFFWRLFCLLFPCIQNAVCNK